MRKEQMGSAGYKLLTAIRDDKVVRVELTYETGSHTPRKIIGVTK